MKRKYDKLVRDNIPNIIRAKGKKCITKVLTAHIEIDRYRKLKALEELDELKDAILRDENIEEELVDVIETVMYYKHGKCTDLEFSMLQFKMNRKDEQNGKFDKNIVLKEVSQNESV